jgi:hypothetical protein
MEGWTILRRSERRPDRFTSTELFKAIAMESHEQPRSGACRLAGRHAFDIPAKIA